MAEPIDWPPRRPKPRRRGWMVLLAIAAVILFSASTTISYYVEALWFSALGYSDVFWKSVNLQALTFGAFAILTFVALYGSFLLLKPSSLCDMAGGTIMITDPAMSSVQ